MPDESTVTGASGRALASRRAVIDIVRSATLGSYGVAGFAGNPIDRLVGALEGRPGGLRVSLAGGVIEVRLRLRVAHGVPIAEVARQVDSAIRYGVRRATGREVDRISIRVAGLEREPGGGPPAAPSPPGIGSSDLAGSGTDVA